MHDAAGGIDGRRGHQGGGRLISGFGDSSARIRDTRLRRETRARAVGEGGSGEAQGESGRAQSGEGAGLSQGVRSVFHSYSPDGERAGNYVLRVQGDAGQKQAACSCAALATQRARTPSV